MSRTPIVRSRRTAVAVLGVAALGAAALSALVTLPASAATSASVSVTTGTSLATLQSTGLGMNVATWDGRMNDPATAGLLKGAGVGVVRYPGGSYGDIYHWQTGTAENGGYIASNTGFDAFMGTVRTAGAQPMIIANYGTGTPAEAAAWVRYANVTKGYGAKYWEIGNEIYGNGEYGASWEADNHSSHSATTYANNLVQYATAMKAVDPTIKIGAVLTTPGNWPDGITGPGDTADWNHTVLSIAASQIDFVVVHHYPNPTTAAELLGRPKADIPGMTSALKALIKQYGGSRAASIGIAVTETNSSLDPDTAPAGLFAPDNYLTWLENGAFNVDWWVLRNGTDCSKVTTVNGATDYNDGGVVSSGASCEPAADTPFPTYYGIQMITKLGAAGDTLVGTTSSQSLLTSHAVRRANGDVAVMLINKDPNNAFTVSLGYSGFTPASGAPTVLTYPLNGKGITTATTGSATSQTVPAYSIVVVQVPRSGSSPSPTTPSPTTPSPTTPSPTTPTPTTPSPTTPSPTTPTPTTPSPSSSTPTPTGSATCRVAYVKNEWSGGLTANLTVTNTGTSAINGWKVGFTFPGDTKVTNAWNATVSQSGRVVSAVPMSYNGTIAAGGNVSFGFQGTWTSNDASPTAFTLNGATCA